MADSKINDYLVEYHFGDPEKTECHHFSLDGILRLAEDGAFINRVEDIRRPPYRPFDVTGKIKSIIARTK